MKPNTTQQWKKTRALQFLFFFFCNCKESIEDSDVFELVASLRTRTQWLNMIKTVFPGEKIARMKASRNFGDRLDLNNSKAEFLREIWQAQYARARLRRVLLAVISEELEAHMEDGLAKNPFTNRLLELQRLLRLDNFEMDVLLVLSFVAQGILSYPDMHGLCSRLEAKCEFVACCLDRPVSQVKEVLDDKHRLRRYGCVDSDGDFNKKVYYFLIGRKNEPYENEYFMLWRGEVLPWSFFGDMAKKHGPLLRRMISGRTGKPVNILVYGGAGTGKSSFVRSLAAELHRECYLVRQNVSDSRSQVESSPDSRFGALQFCADHVYPDDCIIVVDEADKMLRGNESTDEILTGSGFPVGNKCLVNSILDSVRAPTFWIINSSPDTLDATARRRFDYSIRFEPLTATSRRMIWRNNVSRMKMDHLVSDDMQNDFADRYPVSAGGISMVVQNLAGLSPRPEEVKDLVGTLMASHCRLTGITLDDRRMALGRDYSLEGLNIKSELPLRMVVKAIRNFQTDTGDPADRPRMNVLLSGPPGTGKTEFVKYLSRELNTAVLVKMGSDLLNMFVGGTEQRIRNAFEAAESQKAILFLDEIDGMGQNRMRAVRNWEVTQVEELLHRMDVFNGVMIGATNFGTSLDDAFLRRFTYKLEFDYLDEAGKELFFERMFHTPLTKAESRELAQIPMLAPGDFRTVRQSLYYLGDEVDNRDRIAALARESEIKLKNKCAPKRKIGF